MREGDFDAWDSLNIRFAGSFSPETRLISAAGRGDAAAVERGVSLQDAAGGDLGYFAREIARSLWQVQRAERIARAGTRAGHALEHRLSAYLALAEISLARGSWRDAKLHADSAARLDPLRARLFRAAAATLPFQSLPPAEYERVLAELRTWDAARPDPNVPQSLTTSLFPHVRLYYLGLLNARLGRYPEALADAAAVERLPVHAGAAEAARDLARTVRAEVAWRQGRAGETLEHAAAVRGEVPLEILPGGNVQRLGDLVFSQEHPHYLRALALVRLGRDEEALPWLQHAFTLMPGELLYRRPADEVMAGIHERAGRVAEARRLRSREPSR